MTDKEYYWTAESALKISLTSIDMVATHRTFGALSQMQLAAAAVITMMEDMRDTHPSMTREMAVAITNTQQGCLIAQHAERKHYLQGSKGED